MKKPDSFLAYYFAPVKGRCTSGRMPAVLVCRGHSFPGMEIVQVPLGCEYLSLCFHSFVIVFPAEVD